MLILPLLAAVIVPGALLCPVRAVAQLWVDRPVGSIEVVGLRRTRPEVVLRELRVQVGAPLDWATARSDELRLLDTGLFADVRVEVRRDARMDRPALSIRVEERPAFALLPILEYDPEDGWSYGAYLADRNVRGRAERLSASAVWGDRRGAALGYARPWIFGRRLGLAASVFLSDQEKPTERIRERSSGVAWSVSPALDYTSRVSLFGGVEDTRTRPSAQDELHPPPREREDHRWLGLQHSRDTRDYRVRAREGTLLRANATLHGGVLGGDADFVRYGLDALVVLPTPLRGAATLASRASFSDGPVPTYLRQTLGGVNTLRGHPQGQYGGESRWFAWVEERVPLLDRRTVHALGRTLDYALDLAAFIDAGAIWDGDALRNGEVRALWGGGVGLRAVVPWVDLVRFDVATDGERVEVYAVGGLRL